MSAMVSSSMGKPYGVMRVCSAWGIPRSSFYHEQCPSLSSDKQKTVRIKGKRGPKTKLSDDELLALIREDLEASPFIGEGHRKVWARLRYTKKIKVGKKRVLRIMRENNLLSPHRVSQKPKHEHKGRIVTDEPGVMWGTDGAKVFTLDEGWGWIFACLEHWNSEVMGWNVVKHGDRFAACEPVSQGLMKAFGGIKAQIARGLSLRMDHGSQYTSYHFQNQIKYWGIAPSFAFVEQPQTNGVAERFFRTLKEQVIYGRVYRNLEEVRQAVSDFVELYNSQWLIEKNGYLSPLDARKAYYEGMAA